MNFLSTIMFSRKLDQWYSKFIKAVHPSLLRKNSVHTRLLEIPNYYQTILFLNVFSGLVYKILFKTCYYML